MDLRLRFRLLLCRQHGCQPHHQQDDLQEGDLRSRHQPEDVRLGDHEWVRALVVLLRDGRSGEGLVSVSGILQLWLGWRGGSEFDIFIRYAKKCLPF